MSTPPTQTPRVKTGELALAADVTLDRLGAAIAIVTRYSLSHTQARMAATRAGARIASMPDITISSASIPSRSRAWRRAQTAVNMRSSRHRR